jgi:hypothetical protein
MESTTLTWRAVLTLIVIMVFVWQGLRLTIYTAQYCRGRPLSIMSVFAGLGQKLIMTLGLGIFFSSLYIITVWGIAHALHDEEKRALLQYAREHPIACIYGGLILFVVISLTILVIRCCIKRVCNGRSRK